jgi:hypothetical protein
LNRTNNGSQTRTVSGPRRGAFVAAMALAAGATLLAGCGEKPFAKVNGKVITMDEYVKALERQQVQVPGGQATNAERLVIDQLIGNKIITDEASKAGVLPTDDEVNRFFEFRKKLFEAQYPDKKFEDVIKDQGSTTEEIKSEIRVQLSETNVYAKRLKLTEDDTRKAFEQFKGQYLPQRVQLRYVLVMPNSPDFNEAKKLLDAKTPFEQVAKKINLLPNLKASGGRLAPAPQPMTQVLPKLQNDVQKAADGAILGPMDLEIQPGAPPVKAWVQVEKKYPAFTVGYDEAKADVLRQVVQQKILDPANATVRTEIMKMKMNATFEPSSAAYNEVWGAVKKQAQDSGIFDQAAAAPTAAPGAPVPMAPPAGAPAAPPAAKKP